MRHVDALSRNPVVQQVESDVLAQIKKCQAEDAECEAVIKLLQCGKEYKNFELRREVLYRFVDGGYLVVVPRGLQNQIITAVHENGHIGARKVEVVVSQDYFIDKLAKKCARIVGNCVRCILSSRKLGKQEGWCNAIEKFGLPLHTFHVDHLGPLPSTAKSYQYIFVVVDGFTKFIWLYPVKNTTSSEVVKRLEEQADVFGHPIRIVSDRGSAFTSKEFREFCENSKIEHVLTTTRVPRGNGQVERMNGIIVPALTKLSVEDPMKWYRHTNTLQRFINSTKSRSTGQAPFTLLFGVSMRNKEDVELAAMLEDEIRADFERGRNELRSRAKDNIKRVQEETRRSFNKSRKESHKYNVGDLAVIKKTQFSTGSKLQPMFLGPYKVVKVKGYDRYEVQRVGEGPGPRMTSSAADFMKPWAGTEDETDSDQDDEEDDDQEGDDQDDE